MPSPQLVMAGAALARGVRSDFLQTYTDTYQNANAVISNFVDLDVPSDKIEELYVYNETAPYPQRVEPGEANRRESFKSVSYTVRNEEFQSGVFWYHTDAADDQTGGSILRQARSAGANFATLDERLSIQVLTATSNPRLLPSVPNAPDGAALFSATAGDGSDRFGISGGNIITGSGVATPTAIQTDFYSTITRMGGFKDTKGEPLHNPSSLRNFTVVYNVANDFIFKKAFEQNLIFQSTGTVGADLAAAAPSNILRDLTGQYLSVTLMPTQRVTGDSFYVTCDNVDLKPIFIQQRQAIQEFTYTMGSGAYTPQTARIEGVDWLCRKGVGVNIPYGAVQVDNS